MRIFLILVFFVSSGFADELKWESLPPVPDELGVAGAYAGLIGDEMFVAGGANFPQPVWDNDKVWHDNIYALNLKTEEWRTVGKLPRPLGYGASVSVPEGIVCFGGNDSQQVYADAFLIKSSGEIESLPPLPLGLCYHSATFFEGYIYLAGGTADFGLETAQSGFWRMKWEGRGDWEELATWDGPARAFHALVAQAGEIFLIGGRHIDESGATKFLSDLHAYNPKMSAWRKCADMPHPWCAGSVIAVGDRHLITLSGADGSLFATADELKDEHPGFPKISYAYHTITDTWRVVGELPENQVTTTAVKWGDSFILPTGEVRPRVRTPKVWMISASSEKSPFASGNWVTIGLYLGAVLGIGAFFTRRNHSTDDFFRGGQRVPGWVAGLSIFATMLSSITFIALPATAFATDWTMAFVNAGILLCAPIIVWLVIPHFRKIDVTSAYEYLETRFNLAVRLFASASFVIFQIGRMAIVMYLPALALAVITPLSLESCILIMGVMSIVYCTLGGFEAVVWTDALQAVVLLAGGMISFFLIGSRLDGGFGEIFSTALADGKMRWADFDFSASSYLKTSFWVVLIGGIGSALIPYTADQSVVQRYVSTPTKEKAQGAIWLNAGLSILGTILFFSLGSALYAFYKTNPSSLEVASKTDSIFPLFMAQELPVGIAGLVIAAVFAAAQSTISTSMNSTATVIVTDFFRRLGWKKSETAYLKLARVLTVVLGTIGTASALVMASGNVESAWQMFLSLIGFIMGPLCGLFFLGMFTRSGNTMGALFGAVGGVGVLIWAKYATSMHGLLYAPLGIAATFGIGWLVSQIFSKKNQPA